MKLFRNFRIRRKLVVLFLIYALFITSYFSLQTFSKYISITNNRTGTKDVAKWDVELDTSSSTGVINLVSGNESTDQDYILSITSESEVAVDCSLLVTNLPTGIQISVDGQTTYTEDNHRIYIGNFCSFNANNINRTKSFVLTFIAPLETGVISNRQIGIDVSCTQRSI